MYRGARGDRESSGGRSGGPAGWRRVLASGRQGASADVEHRARIAK